MEKTAPSPFSNWERSTTRRILRFLCSRKFWIGVAWAVSLIVLSYAFIDWHDRREWNAYRENYEAHVGPLDFAAYIPKPVPDSDNFAMTPFVKSWMNTGPSQTNGLFLNDAYWRAACLMGDSPSTPKGAKHVNYFLDLPAWQRAFAAGRDYAHESPNEMARKRLISPHTEYWSTNFDTTARVQAARPVLDELQDDQAAFDELHAASARPDVRYPVRYNLDDPWGILVPHLSRIKQTCQRLELKACAELAISQGDKALDDIKLMLYVADTAKDEPFLISYLVRIASIQITMEPIREGLAERRWTDAQLAQLQSWLDHYNFLRDLNHPLRAELAGGVLTVDLLKKKGLGMLANFGNYTPGTEPVYGDTRIFLDAFGKLIPSGWYDEEKLHYSMLFEDEFRGSMDEASERVFPSVVNSQMPFGGHVNGIWSTFWHHETLARLLLPALQGLPKKAAAAQTAVNQAYIACGLERYRLANGQYPDSLDKLAPRYSNQPPNDVITGEPYKYRRTDDGNFLLYSVGWNEKDDGGVPGHLQFDDSAGDWVWQNPVERD